MWKASAAVIFAVVCGLALRAQQPSQMPLPPGPLAARAGEVCLPCHDATIIAQQRLDRAGWTRSVDKMIRWGAPVEPSEREPLIDYFTQHFGPQPEASSAQLRDAPGVRTVRRACLGCHDAQPIVAQQRTRREWAALVDQQIRWGAKLTPQQRQAVVSYFAQNYGVKGEKGKGKS